MKIEISTKPTLVLKKGYPKLMRYIGVPTGGDVVLFTGRTTGYRFGPNGFEKGSQFRPCTDSKAWEPFTGEIRITA